MRCYFFRDNKIEFVETMTGTSDSDVIRQAHELFLHRSGVKYDRLEIWDGQRLVHRFPEPAKKAEGTG
jgi:hypothetical protein